MMNPNGPWAVTTEGDEEGKTTRQLGIYEGPIDRIALALAKKAMYVLDFEPAIVKQANDLPVEQRFVYVRIRAERSWISPKHLLAGRPVRVEKGQYYESYKLIAEEGYAPIFAEAALKSAMQKLTPEELQALSHALTPPPDPACADADGGERG